MKPFRPTFRLGNMIYLYCSLSPICLLNIFCGNILLHACHWSSYCWFHCTSSSPLFIITVKHHVTCHHNPKCMMFDVKPFNLRSTYFQPQSVAWRGMQRNLQSEVLKGSFTNYQFALILVCLHSNIDNIIWRSSSFYDVIWGEQAKNSSRCWHDVRGFSPRSRENFSYWEGRGKFNAAYIHLLLKWCKVSRFGEVAL